MSAATPHWLSRSLAILVFLASMATARDAVAQDRIVRFLGGAALALGVHESAHLLLDVAFDANPGIKKVNAGPFPFFAVTHETVSPAREFAISSAGFWMQHAGNELILARHPRLRAEQAPLLKGMLAFNVLTSIGYAGAAFAQRGPVERDTRGIAASARVGEPLIGAAILAPALLDTVRYYDPGHAWLTWASRATKVAGAVLIVRAAR